MNRPMQALLSTEFDPPTGIAMVINKISQTNVIFGSCTCLLLFSSGNFRCVFFFTFFFTYPLQLGLEIGAVHKFQGLMRRISNEDHEVSWQLFSRLLKTFEYPLGPTAWHVWQAIDGTYQWSQERIKGQISNKHRSPLIIATSWVIQVYILVYNLNVYNYVYIYIYTVVYNIINEIGYARAYANATTKCQESWSNHTPSTLIKAFPGILSHTLWQWNMATWGSDMLKHCI